MSATATSFGDGVWGIGAEETGLIIESITHDFTNSSKSIKDRTGNTKAITYYDEQIKVSLNGKLTDSTPFAGTLAASITLGNTPDNYLKSGAPSGLTVVEGITIDFGNEEYKGIKITATHYPNVAD